MARHRVSSVKMGLLAVASLTLASGTALAQSGGGVNYGGFHSGGFGNVYGSGFSRGLGFTPNYYLPSRGYGASNGLGSGTNLGSGSSLGNGYGSGYRSYPYTTSSYGITSGGGRYLYNTPGITIYSNAYSATQRTPKDDAAHLVVIVPENAELWFNGSKTSHTGVQRAFVSPKLTPGKIYTYDIKARWTENGKPVEQNRSVRVQPNSQQRIDFTRPESAARSF